MSVKKIVIYAVVLACLWPIASSAKVFSLLVPTSQTTCPPNDNGLFTTGQQYVDPNNGVPYDSWSMLVRWQGTAIPGPTQWINNPVSDQVQYTGLSVPYPYSAWQRGYAPQDSSAGTPAVQLHCFDAGMVINSWYAPHQAVVGGGWNDMYGYAWSPQNRPKAFLWNSTTPADLVLQGSLAVPAVDGYRLNPNGLAWTQIQDLKATPSEVSIQYNLFAYIRDTSHPNLKPIALLGAVYGNRYPNTGCESGLGYDYPAGVWYASSTIRNPSSCQTNYATTVYSSGYTTNNPFQNTKFYRIHFTRGNLVHIVNGINSYPSCDGSCPSRGYSTNPDNYVLDYFGVILETKLCHPNGSCSTAFLDRQVSAAARGRSVAAYSYHD